MKSTTRNGLIALIAIVLAIDVVAVVVRARRGDPKTQVSSSPTSAPSTTITATTTTTAATTTLPTTIPASTTTTIPGDDPPVVAAPATSTTSPTAAQAPVDATHPKTGAPSLLLPALILIGLGLAGLRLGARSAPRRTRSPNNKEDRPWPPTS